MSSIKSFFSEQKVTLWRLIGSGCRAFLHGQTTSDFLNASQDAFVRTCWLNPVGGVKAILEVRLIDNGAEIVVIGGDSQALIDGFDKVIFPSDHVSFDSSEELRRIQQMTFGRSARFANVAWVSQDKDFPKEFANLYLATSKDFEQWRLKDGLPIGEGELNGKHNPFELGLSDLVDLSKGCYLGQETLAKISNQATVKQSLMFWDSKINLSVGQALIEPSISNKNVALITSTFANKKTSSSFGLAMVKRSALDKEKLFTKENLAPVDIRIPSGFVSLLEEFGSRSNK